MSDRRLQVFHTVAGVLSFTKAAEILNMTQPAVTFQVRQLEEDFNTRLFDRSHNKISLTRAGELVLGYANQIVDLYGEMHESVKAMTGNNAGLITLGASTTIAEYMLPGLLGDFRKQFPEIMVHLKVANTDAIVAMVEDNTIELGVVEGEVNNQLLRVEDCLVDELVVISGTEHRFNELSAIKAQELVDQPFIYREDGSGTRSVITQYLKEQGIEESQLNKVFELGSTEAIKGAVEAGMGVSIVSAATLSKELSLGTLATVQLDPPIRRQLYFVRQRQKFRTHLMEELFQFAQTYCEARSRGKDTANPLV